MDKGIEAADHSASCGVLGDVEWSSGRDGWLGCAEIPCGGVGDARKVIAGHIFDGSGCDLHIVATSRLKAVCGIDRNGAEIHRDCRRGDINRLKDRIVRPPDDKVSGSFLDEFVEVHAQVRRDWQAATPIAGRQKQNGRGGGVHASGLVHRELQGRISRVEGVSFA